MEMLYQLSYSPERVQDDTSAPTPLKTCDAQDTITEFGVNAASMRSGPTAKRITAVISNVEIVTRTANGSSRDPRRNDQRDDDGDRVHPRHVGGDATPERARLGSARSDSSNQLSTPTVRWMRSCDDEAGGAGHQRCPLRRTLPLAQVNAVDEAEDDLVLATVGPGVQHAGAEAAVELAQRGHHVLGPLDVLRLEPGRHRASHRDGDRVGGDTGKLGSVERTGKSQLP